MMGWFGRSSLQIYGRHEGKIRSGISEHKQVAPHPMHVCCFVPSSGASDSFSELGVLGGVSTIPGSTSKIEQTK